MGIFVEKMVDDSALREVVRTAMQADPADAADPAKVANTAADAKAATEANGTVKWKRIGVGLLIGAGLLLAGIALSIYADSWAVDQALRKVASPTYVVPASSIPALATSIMTLAAAWSAGLIGVVLSEK
jgi:hypothetical protein